MNYKKVLNTALCRASLFADAISSCGGTFGGSGQTQPSDLEHEDLPPPASAGRNGNGNDNGTQPQPNRSGQGGGRSVDALAAALAKAVATGAEFG